MSVGKYGVRAAGGQDGVMTLVEFLRARLDEDAEPCEGASEYVDCHDLSERRARDVEAKRRLLDSHYDYHGVCPRCFDWQNRPVEREEFPCEVVRLLALPYADHTDYDEAWRP